MAMVDSIATGRAPSAPSPAVHTLSAAERTRLTAELLHEASATGDDDRRSDLLDRVTLLNRSVAEAVAGRYLGCGVPVDALYQAAFDGLVGAVRTFDPALSSELLPYAVPKVHAAVESWLRDQSWLVRPPRPASR